MINQTQAAGLVPTVTCVTGCPVEFQGIPFVVGKKNSGTAPTYLTHMTNEEYIADIADVSSAKYPSHKSRRNPDHVTLIHSCCLFTIVSFWAPQLVNSARDLIKEKETSFEQETHTINLPN